MPKQNNPLRPVFRPRQTMSKWVFEAWDAARRADRRRNVVGRVEVIMAA